MMATFCVYQSAVHDWRERPDTTTIETVTRPVTELKFPTVTVCPSRDTPVDPFAAITRLLSPIKFQCGSRGTMVPEANCNETRILREKFDFLYNFAFETLKESITSIYDSGTESVRIHSGLLWKLRQKATMLDAILATNVSYQELLDGIKQQFGRTLSKEHFDTLERRYQVKESQFLAEPSLSARKLAALTVFSLCDLGSFGAFVSEVAPLLDPDRFSRRVRYSISNKKTCGSKMPSGSLRLHGLFSKLTAAVASLRKTGREAEEREVPLPMSMFELPDLVGQKLGRSLLLPLSSEKMSYTQCYTGSTPYEDCDREVMRYLRSLDVQDDSCVRNKSLFCCDSPNLLKQDLEMVMQVMRLSKHKGEDLEELDQFVQVASKLGYPHFTVKKGSMYRDKKYVPLGKDPFTMIPVCSFVHQDQKREMVYSYWRRKHSTCNLFFPSITDSGLCFSFNTLPFEEVFKPSHFTSIFKRVFKRALKDNVTQFNAQPYEEDLGLTFLVDKQMILRNVWNNTELIKKGGFKISFAEPNSMMLTRTRQRSVQLGHHTTFLLTPLVLLADEDLRNMPPEMRNCLFPDENKENLVLLQHYSQAGCFYECMVQHARHICHCTPWDFPFSKNDPIKICNGYGYFCFGEIMKNISYMSKECDCLPDCNVVEYQISESVSATNVEDHCKPRTVKMCGFFVLCQSSVFLFFFGLKHRPLGCL